MVRVPQTNREIRAWYLKELAQISVLNEQWISNRVSLKTRAKRAWKLRHDNRIEARSFMVNEFEVGTASVRRIEGKRRIRGHLVFDKSKEYIEIAMGTKNYLNEEIFWKRAKDARFPFKASYDGQTIVLRLNDFPAEHLYTLIADSCEVNFDDWPKKMETKCRFCEGCGEETKNSHFWPRYLTYF